MTESERPRRPHRVLLYVLLAAAVMTALDLGTKHWAQETLSAESLASPSPVCEADESGFIRTQRRRRAPIVVIDGIFELSYAENCGAAFGFLRDFSARRWVFYPAALFALLLLPWMVRRGQGGPWLVAGVPFIIAGALGNLHDRIVLGYVVDFIRFYTRDGFAFLQPGWEYPTFNVADIYITIGVVCIVVDSFVEERRRRRAHALEDGSEPSASHV